MAETTATASSEHDSPEDSSSAPAPWYTRSEHMAETNPVLLSKIEKSFTYEDGQLIVIIRKDNVLSLVRCKEAELVIPPEANTSSANASSAELNPAVEGTSEPSLPTVSQVIDDEGDFTMILLPHIFQHRSLHGLDPRRPGTMNFSIGLSKKTFDATMEILKVHPLFIEALYSRVGQYGILDSHTSGSTDPSIMHIIVKVPPAGHLEAAFYIQFDTKRHKMRLIIAGHDLENLAQDSINSLQLEQGDLDPFDFALILIRRYYYYLEAQCVQIDHAVIMTERETGYGAVAYSDGQANHTIQPDKFDLVFMHWIEGNQRNLVYASQFQSKLSAFLMQAHIARSRPTATTASQHPSLTQMRANSLRARFSLHQTAVEGLHAATLVMRERIQRQLSAADSTINKYDNKISQQNATANTIIAEQSRKIAFETQKDSTSMKTIAGLTMVYLPITFTATIFSTGFFTFDSNDAPIIVSPLIWILFVVGVTLTIITIFVWIWLNKYGIPKQLSWARHGQLQDEKSGSLSIPNLNEANLFQQGPSRPPLQILSDPRVDLPAAA